MSALPEPVNRRQFRRVRIDADVRVYSDRAMWPTRSIDVSLKGAMIERPAEWSGECGKTQRLELRFHALLIVSVNATVVHLGTRFIGYRFQRMDLDSFMRLKRIIELNLGDPELLSQELVLMS
ncbi:MAG TPA: PilZ domain-containing protein [Xanthomonadales bacterium]|nr:PilZ domain-containing protein [Xanthomonadales bacterium]